MSISTRLQKYLADRQFPWDPVVHDPSSSCLESAHSAHVAPDRVAKAVVLKGNAGYLMAVLPASHHLDIEGLGEALGDDLALVSESNLDQLFTDCSPGAVPPVGAAYGIRTLWDEGLGRRADIYFESGDHKTLVHMKGADFRAMMTLSAAKLPESCH
jgi:Ala-tRNA(Pro) deacylase